MKFNLIALALLLGFSSALYGVWIIYPPASFILGGVALMLGAFLAAYDRMRPAGRP